MGSSSARPMMSTPDGVKLNTPVPDGPGNSFNYSRNGNLRPDSGIDIYILDTGIKLLHPLFEGRASNFEGTTTSRFCNGETMDDVQGHGTAVASCA